MAAAQSRARLGAILLRVASCVKPFSWAAGLLCPGNPRRAIRVVFEVPRQASRSPVAVQVVPYHGRLLPLVSVMDMAMNLVDISM